MADKSDGYLTTGLDSSCMSGNYVVAASATYGNFVPFAGITFVSDGAAAQCDVIEGSGVLSGRNVRLNPDATNGTARVTDFAKVTARRIDEPSNLPLLVTKLGLLVLGKHAALRCRGLDSARYVLCGG